MFDVKLSSDLKSLQMLCLLLLLPLVATANGTLTANAPQQVQAGQQFRLTYTANSHDVSGFRIGQIPTDAFEVLMGPSTSTQSSFSMINGKTTQSSTVTYTYILSALKNGTFTIPPATIQIDGSKVSSNAVKIQVVGTAQGGGSSARGGGSSRGAQTETRPAGSAISGSDLFIKVSASKRRVVEQEPILLTYKIYTLVSLTQLDGKMPDLKGFHTQEVPLPQEKSFKLETLNGRTYKTVVWQQYVMYPQMTGKLQIPSLTYNGIVVQQNRNVDPFEAFFNGGSSYIEVKKQIVAPSVEIQVDPLPARPQGFSGGVGHFSVKAEMDKHEVKANDPVTLRVTVSGTGNMKLIKEPVVEFPKDFDVYDPKVTDKTRLTTNGAEGSIVYEYLAVPRHQGKYDIPAIKYVYYDPQAAAYKTLTTESFHLDVAKGEGSESSVQSFTNQEDVQMLAKDIRHIKLGRAHQHGEDEFFFGSWLYWLLLLVLMVVFVTLVVVFRQRAIENADLAKSRGKRANKVATKRLKKAAQLMKQNQPSMFYDEVLRALWGYVGDKLNIPVGELSRENITERLQERSVEAATINKFIEALDECEFVRYAPGDPQGNMNKVYDKAMNAIEEIENIKKMNKHKKAGATLLLCLCTLLPLTAGAQHEADSTLTKAEGNLAATVTKAEGDSAYTSGQYQQAIDIYTRLLSQGVSAELYFNLGNAYYRTENITQAILAYERALLLQPGDADTRFNLQLARSKTVDKIVPESEMFFVTWYRSLVNMRSVDGWARTAVVSLLLAVVLMLLYLFSNPLWLRKTGFFGGIVMLLVFCLSNLFAWQQKQQWEHRSGAIIMESAVNVKSTPAASGTDLFILHEGTKVNVTDSSMKDWREIRVADGKQGWVMASQIEMI